MAKDKTTKSNSIIKNHMVLSMGAGMIPVPILDFVAVSAIQMDMIRQLSNNYGLEFEENQGKAIISALTGAGIARLGAGMIKVLPVVGSVLGGITFGAISGASTYALGEVFKKHFESGGDFLSFNTDNFKSYYKEKFDQGKDMAKKMEDEEIGNKNADSVEVEIEEAEIEVSESKVEQLERLAKLKSDKLITEAEFKKMKKEIIG